MIDERTLRKAKDRAEFRGAGGEQYERELREQLLSGLGGKEKETEHPARKAPVFREFVDEFMAFQASPAASRRGGNKPGELHEKRRAFDNHLIQAFGERRLDQIRARDIDLYVAGKHAEGSAPAGGTSGTSVEPCRPACRLDPGGAEHHRRGRGDAQVGEGKVGAAGPGHPRDPSRDEERQRPGFRQFDGSPIGRTTLSKALDRAARKANLLGSRRFVNVHMLRHTFASHAVMAGVPIRVVQEWLCHADITQTMRYAHLSPDNQRGLIDRLVPGRDRAEHMGST